MFALRRKGSDCGREVSAGGLYMYNACSVDLKMESSWAGVASAGPQHPTGTVPRSVGCLENLSETHLSPPDPQGDACWVSVLALWEPSEPKSLSHHPCLAPCTSSASGAPAGRTPTDRGSCAAPAWAERGLLN